MTSLCRPRCGRLHQAGPQSTNPSRTCIDVKNPRAATLTCPACPVAVLLLGRDVPAEGIHPLDHPQDRQELHQELLPARQPDSLFHRESIA